MAFHYNDAQRQAIDFIMDRRTQRFDIAVTLTFKYRISAERRKEILKVYLNLLHKAVYGSACWQRVFKYDLQKGIKMVSIMEYRFGNEPHFHFAMKKPEFISKRRFKRLIKHCWIHLDDKWKMNITSNKFNKVKNIYDEVGWISYIIKQIDPHNTDALLIEYCNF